MRAAGGILSAPMSSSLSCPVLIVGASLGGCTAALELAKLGVPALLVDKSSFPRRKACGEGLSARGVAALKSCGFDPRERSLESAELTGYRLVDGARETALHSSEPILGVKRSILDATLLELALAKPSISLRQGAVVRDVEREGSHFRVRIGSDVVRAQSLIVADGAASPTATRLGLLTPKVSSRRVGCSSAWRVVRGALEKRVLVVLTRRGEFYLTPTGASSVNISLLGDARFVAECGSVDALKAWLSQRRGLLGVELEVESPPLGAGPLNSQRRGSAIGSAFLVGDACETFDPIGGMGMAHAVETGLMAARAVRECLESGDIPAAARWYDRAQQRAAREMRGFTRLTSWMLGTGAGRAVMPCAVASGVATRISHAAHSPGRASGWRLLLGAVGAAS